MPARPWGEMVICGLALPAVLSPLIVMPVPSGVTIPPLLLRLAMICLYPRFWAVAASVAAGIWVKRGHAIWPRKVGAIVIALIAWIPAFHTATVLEGLARL